MLVFIALLVIHVCIAGTIPATPENITVTFLTPTSVRVAWQTMLDLQTHPIEKYLVTYKPTDDRVVQQVAGNSEAVILDRLSPSTQYSITVTAIWAGKKYRSRQVIFRTLDLPRNSAHQDLYGAVLPMAPHGGSGHGFDGFPDDAILGSSSNTTNVRELPQIRGVEVGIVLIVLLVWAGAIALFFNRWGKIRMLLPYQPDYKQEQLKVPGTGVCTGAACTGQHSHQPEEESDVETVVSLTTEEQVYGRDEQSSTAIAERCSRSRINSAIFVSSEGKGFDSIEFLRRHGSQSVLCRKAKSAENLNDEERNESAEGFASIMRRFPVNRQWNTEDSSQPSETIELTECHVVPSTAILVASNTAPDPSTQSTTMPHSAVVTTANTIVGSISIETPPPHIQKEQQEEMIKQQQQLQQQSSIPQIQPPPPPVIQALPQRKRPQLTRQKSSTSAYQGRSPSVSPTNSTAHLNLNNVKSPSSKPALANLPTLSVSGPSPPHEGEFL